MLLVVKLHDLAGDVGLESIVGVRKVGESVARHVFCCVCVGGGRWRRVGMRENWYDLAGAIYLANLDWADPLSISKL